jgi:mono/diheme cytochrome c family protein
MNKTDLWQTVLALALLGVATANGGEEPVGDVARGKVVYARYCVSCHGERGDGNGEFAQWITPKPRDYRQGIFKWRSTPSGSLPLLSDLERTIENGVYDTYMPSWYAIGPQARRDVIAYIQTFSPRWQQERPATPVAMVPETPNTADSVARGRTLYEESGCPTCHGEDGRSDIPGARSLKDDWGNPILAADLTQEHLKCGTTAGDIYRVFMTGMNGTPMPSYAGSLSSDQAWDLAHYVRSLSEERKSTTRSWRDWLHWVIESADQ